MVVSLFLVMFLFTGMTIMVANLRTDTRMSQQAFEITQYRFATQGAVNKLHTLLQNGSAPEDFPRERPLKVNIGTFEDVEAWVIEDESSGIYHLRSEWDGIAYSKVIAQTSAGGALIYANEGGALKFAGVDDVAWTALPPPPPKGYDAFGLEVDSYDLQASQYFQANNSGKMAAFFSGTNSNATYLWDEGTQSWNDVPPPRGWRYVDDEVVPTGPPSVRTNVFLGENTLFTYDNISSPPRAPVSIVFCYDLATGTWRDLKGPFDGVRLTGGLLGPDDSFIAEVEDNSGTRLARLDGNTWTELPPLPGGATHQRVRASGPEGELYVTSDTGDLYQLSDGEWSFVDVPSTQDGESLGTLHSVDAEGGLLFRNRDTELVHRWDRSTDVKGLPEIEEFLGVSGGGTDAPVAQGFTTTATY